jgi:hypothetical protein
MSLKTNFKPVFKKKYPFTAVDKREAPPSSERPRGSEEGHLLKKELAHKVKGYKK